MEAFESLSITHHQKAHVAVDSFQTWVDTVAHLDAEAGITKTLVLKPSKGPNSNLILVLSLNTTQLSVGALAKSLGYKDARMAADDLVLSSFGSDKINLTPFALSNVKDKSAVTVVIDQNVFEKNNLAFRGFDSAKSLFVASTDLKAFLETSGIELNILDFANLRALSTTEKKVEMAKPDGT